jgi:class 3 adenylate cyclase
MKHYYKERYELQRRLSEKLASTMKVNEILEKLRDEARNMVPTAMEACILLLDPDADKYTLPLQCSLYDRPVNCLSCKRNRTAVQKALTRRKGIIIFKNEPIRRHDGTLIETGPEAAVPVFIDEDILGVVSVVSKPGNRFTKKDFYLIKDLSEVAGNAISSTKKHWEVTQEKIRISQMLARLFPFVPQSVRHIVENNPDSVKEEKVSMEVTVLFLDLEGYTNLSARKSDVEVNEIVEKIFSSFVDPVHRSGGDINETAGDGLMIIFKNDDARTNAINAVKAAFDIYQINLQLNRDLVTDFGPINVNMGINSGAALVGMTKYKGSLTTRMTYTASGNVTNIAARLAAYAQGGNIIVGNETRKIIGNLWPVFDLGEVLIKGLDTPLRIYSLKKGLQ